MAVKRKPVGCYYNDNDPFAAEWLRELIRQGHLSGGIVDERPIQEVRAGDLEGYRQHHFFCGIGGWPLALALAGWPATRPVWTGSCPCQPFSSAGKRKGNADERHVWPHFLRLIRDCRPATCLGEQVSGRDGLRWLAGVRDDLEACGYAVGAADLPACSQGAPHIRQRLFWVADAQETGRRRRGKLARDVSTQAAEWGGLFGPEGRRVTVALADGVGQGLEGVQVEPARQKREAAKRGGGVSRMADPDGRHAGNRNVQRGGEYGQQPIDGSTSSRLADSPGRGSVKSKRLIEEIERRPADEERGVFREYPQGTGGRGGPGFWSASDLVPCRDGKVRRVEPGSFPLAHGVPRRVGSLLATLAGMGVDPKAARRVLRNIRSRLAKAGRNRPGRLRGYGNAIAPQVAAAFIRAFLEAETDILNLNGDDR